MSEIARRTAIDHIRTRQRWKLLHRALAAQGGEEHHRGAPGQHEVGDPLENLRFVVLEFFYTRQSRCHELAGAYFEETQWEAVADRLGQTHAAVRKQWSRCLALLKRALEADPDMLWHSPRPEREPGDG